MNYENEKSYTHILKSVFFSILAMSFVIENISGSVKFRHNIFRIIARSSNIFLMHVSKTD